MKASQEKLRMVKTVHTVIWAVMVAAIFFILYAGWSGEISSVTYASVGLMMLEGAALVVGKGSCPLTPVARQFSDSPKANFDIYLPEWLAKYNKQIFGTLLAVGLTMLAWRMYSN